MTREPQSLIVIDGRFHDFRRRGVLRRTPSRPRYPTAPRAPGYSLVVVEVEAHGVRYSVVGEPGDELAEGLRAKRKPYESGLLSFLRPLVSPRDFILDIGANIGNHALYLCLVCQADVAAFEPHPTALRYLRSNIAANRCAEKITVYPVALGASRGTGSIVPGSQHNLAAAHVEAGGGSIPIETVDSYGFRDVALIKLDVEGSEVAVLSGARRTIIESRPLVVAESRTVTERKAVTAALAQHGYVRLRKRMASSPTYIYFPNHRAMVEAFSVNLPRMAVNRVRKVLRHARARLAS